MRVFEAGDHWGEWGLVFGVRGRGEGAHGAAMEAVGEGEDLRLVACRIADLAYFTGEFDCCFIGFAPGIADEDFCSGLHPTLLDCLLHNKLTQLTYPGIVVEITAVNEGLGLLAQELADLRIRVS